MSKFIEIVKSALDEHKLNYYSYDSDSDEVVRLNINGANMAIGADNSFVRIQCNLSLSFNDEDMLQQAYQLVNQWNMENIVKYYMDSDGDLVMEWNIDVNGDSFNEAIFMAGFSRIFTALHESKEPILKLRYS